MHIRWMIRRDMPQVHEIEKASFPDPWEPCDFSSVLRTRNCIGMVAEGSDELVMGYIIYELHKKWLHVINLAVAPHHRRKGVGGAMINKLKSKLSPQRRSHIQAEVRDTNLPGHLFFKSMDFLAIDTVRGFYDDNSDDSYVFRHTLVPPHLDSRTASTRICGEVSDFG